MSAANRLKVKICFVGDGAVGKTSLIRRYVLNAYDDHYIATIGTKVSRKEVRLVDPLDVPLTVDMTIWDIMGQPGFLHLLRDAYFTGANGILAVADVTRWTTLESLTVWIAAVEDVTGPVPIVVAVNKSDLADGAAIRADDADRVAAAFGADVLPTSAKTGANVEEAFFLLATRVARHQLEAAGTVPILTAESGSSVR